MIRILVQPFGVLVLGLVAGAAMTASGQTPDGQTGSSTPDTCSEAAAQSAAAGFELGRLQDRVAALEERAEILQRRLENAQ
ncbi:MAG: hypothetical protein ACRC67_01405 [Inquilinus sp.]|uniref:hypothetical protein n=1 Tax=Inquilinus sp. TaxID=1932117 RepID=UPI003F35CEF7